MTRRSLIIAAALVLALLAAAAGYRATASSPSAAATLGPRQTLLRRLQAHGLSVRWVSCTGTGRRFQGRAVVRCNADFGDPHIPAYCMVRVNGAWLDRQAGRRVPCAPDWAGWRVIRASSG